MQGGLGLRTTQIRDELAVVLTLLTLNVTGNVGHAPAERRIARLAAGFNLLWSKSDGSHVASVLGFSVAASPEDGPNLCPYAGASFSFDEEHSEGCGDDFQRIAVVAFKLAVVGRVHRKHAEHRCSTGDGRRDV